MIALLDHVAYQAGVIVAHNLLADVEEGSQADEVMRTAGYAIYTRQQAWLLAEANSADDDQALWRPARDTDEAALRSLYTALVPALVQQTEPPPWEDLNGLVHYQDGNLLAYLQLSHGPRGILAQPFVHPEVEVATDLMRQVQSSIPHGRGRPVYLCIRSHHAWLNTHLSLLSAKPGPRQAVMVKRLVAAQKVSLPLKIPGSGLETARPEVSSSSYSLLKSEKQ
jgi:hypothetical protein